MPFFKTPPIVSEPLREYAKGRPCTLRIPGICQDNGRNTCGCHINSNEKGTGNKSPDLFMVVGCWACHGWMDGGYLEHGVTKAERDAEVLRAYLESLLMYQRAGLVSVEC